ncbi:MAG: class I mannose-6-phosphate isomerase [Oscillospiraceae bacterium]|jgi:mannose-6-phosphate isomerase|nr:class I mannose-6-phosphate isomerase [Oscillospiraceae bacterium]
MMKKEAKPIRLLPAYRHGEDTPWGGDALGRLFGLAIPDDRTGEALVFSTLPGLQSCAEDGRTLEELAGKPLPLLVKLLHARRTLSVQLHPSDALAPAGRSGKEEAWLILHAEPGARLVYGLLPGVKLPPRPGADVEACLRWVPVRAGDILHIPPGTVHAIGGGIVLLEVQQASDITYRLWDWGSARPLHWDQALAAISTDAPPPVRQGSLSGVHFGLALLRVQGCMPLPDVGGFQCLTALGAGHLRYGGEGIPFDRGDTLFIPEGAGAIQIEGHCEMVRAWAR